VAKTTVLTFQLAAPTQAQPVSRREALVSATGQDTLVSLDWAGKS